MIGRAALFSLLLATPALAEPGGWKRTESNRGIAYFAESETADLTPGGQANLTNLMLSCFEEILGAGLLLPRGMGSGPITISLMLDDEPPWQEDWVASESSEAVIGFPDAARARAFIDRIHSGQRLTVQLMMQGRPATYSYDLAKAGAAVDELIASCARQ